jgi:8-oxo-dGTP pyrophosphatase MutT (NUDIX family)
VSASGGDGAAELTRIRDWIIQRGYRAAFRIMRAWWWLRRPQHHGALVAIWLDGSVLIVQQSYRHTLNFPGGGVRRGEPAQEAARRELGEELGLSVDRGDLVHIMQVEAEWDFRHDRVDIFELRLTEPPLLRLDNREVVDARFTPPQKVLCGNVSPFIRSYLMERMHS